MAKTVPDKPQALVDTQFLLSWQGSARTDKIQARIGTEIARVNPISQETTIAQFGKSDAQANGLLLDLSRAPADVVAIDFSFEVTVAGERSWTIEGLNSGEVWQNNSVAVGPDVAATVLTLERQSSGWYAIARELANVDEKALDMDQQVPEDFRDVWRLLANKSAPEAMRNCAAIFEVTSSWLKELPRESSIRLIRTLIAIGAVATTKPVEISLQGLRSISYSLDDDIENSFEIEYASAEENKALASAMFALVPAVVETLRLNSRLYVFVESLFFIDDDLVELAQNKQVEVIILVSNASSGVLEDIDSEFVRVKRLPEPEKFSSKNLVDLLY